MRPNPLKKRLLDGASAYGLFAFEFFTPGLAQIAKEAGAECVLFDMEHSGAGIDAIKQQLAYCRGLDIVPFVRVPTHQYHFVARALDAGALGIMVPMVETAQQAATSCRGPVILRAAAGVRSLAPPTTITAAAA
jgi:2-keto-3-deoxy-L-rhamnonate aldolase RhmA